LDSWLYDYVITNDENQMTSLHWQVDKLMEHVLQFDVEVQ
jgi:hypothetical protein